MTDIPIVERLKARRAFQYAPANAAPQTTWVGQATSVPPLVNPDGPEAAAALKECVEALEGDRVALQAMMDTWLDYHDSHSLTQPVTGASNNAFELALAARDAIDATLAAMTKGEE